MVNCIITHNIVFTTYRTFLRRMVRNGFKQVDRDSNDFRLVISNDALHTTCGTRDVSHFIKTQQSNYASLPECHMNAH